MGLHVIVMDWHHGQWSPRTPWLDQGVVTMAPWLDQCTYLAQQRKNKCWDSLMGLHVYKMEAMEGYTHNMQARGAHDVEAKH